MVLPVKARVPLSVLAPAGSAAERESGAASPQALLEKLASQWRQDTAHQGSVAQRAIHPAYQRIIGHGKVALPFLISKLQVEPDHWFWALCAITGENPVAETDRGDVEAMTRAWLDWGAAHGYV